MKHDDEGQITKIISEIRKCLINEQFIAAITLAMTLPDLCGAAEYGKTEKVGVRYKKWCERFFLCKSKTEEMKFDHHIGFSSRCFDSLDDLSPELLYKLRNKILHTGEYTASVNLQGNEDILKQHLELYISWEEDIATIHIPGDCHDSNLEEIIQFNLVDLCKYLCFAAEYYYEKNQEKFDKKLLPIVDYRDCFS